MIDAIAKSREPNIKEALRLFEEAKTKGFAYAIIYNNTLTSVVKSREPNVKMALRLLEEAKLRGLPTS